MTRAVCVHVGCDGNVFRRQICAKHYRELAGYGCRVARCDKQVHRQGYCYRHGKDLFAPNNPISKKEHEAIDPDDLWAWVKKELKL